MAAGQAAGFNAGLEFLKSWYALTPRESGRFPALSGVITADLAIVGGGERAGRAAPGDIKALVRPWLENRFPQLAGIALQHGWGGVAGVTRSRLPDLGRDGPLLWAQGYSGQGATLATLAGALLAEAAAGTMTRFDRFAGVAPVAFPGGAVLSGPLHVLGLLGQAAREAWRDREDERE